MVMLLYPVYCFTSLSLILPCVPLNTKSLLINFHKMPHFSPICSERSWLTAWLVRWGVAFLACLALLLYFCQRSVLHLCSQSQLCSSWRARTNSRTLFCSLSIPIISFLSESKLKIALWLCSILILPVAKGNFLVAQTVKNLPIMRET